MVTSSTGKTQESSGFTALGQDFQNLTHNPLAKMGYEYTQEKMNKFLSSNKGYLGNIVFSQKMRGYFDVDNTYVIRKLQMMVFPFLRKKVGFNRGSGEIASLEDVDSVSTNSRTFISRFRS